MLVADQLFAFHLLPEVLELCQGLMLCRRDSSPSQLSSVVNYSIQIQTWFQLLTDYLCWSMLVFSIIGGAALFTKLQQAEQLHWLTHDC
jgi:hypothetical protein